MFFRMLRHDLRHNKALHAILFLFMILASALMFVSTATVYTGVTGKERTKTVCHVADGAFLFSGGAHDRAVLLEALCTFLDEHEEITDYAIQERVTLRAAGLDFSGFDEAESDAFLGKSYQLSPQPRDYNLVYGTNDEPFVLHSGQIAVPQNIRILTGAKLGDTLTLTTDLGNRYAFTIAQFYKRTDRWNRFLVSDADYALLCADFPVRQNICQFTMREPSSRAVMELQGELFAVTEQYYAALYYRSDSPDETFSSMIAVFLVCISVFLVLLLFMTIRFTMIAAIKEEQHAIGMMRAIGVDSFGFRWLFAARYIAAAIAGGLIGTAIGFPLSKRVLLEFCPDLLNPPDAALLAFGFGAVAVICVLMILFSVAVMGRIRRISVMEALRGNHADERIGTRLRLHRSRLPVTLYLALADILGKLRRYLVLIVSYTLGAAILLLAVTLRYSACSPHYLRYDLTAALDFYPDFSSEQMKPYDERETYDNISFWDQLREELAEAGIPASLGLYSYTFGDVSFDGEEIGDAYMVYELPETDFIVLADGAFPQTAAECLMSRYTAKTYGITPGDTITLLPDDASEEEMQTLTVTGLFDYLESGTPCLVMGEGYEPVYRYAWQRSWYALTIDGTDKAATFAALCERYGEKHIQTPAQYMRDYMGEYGTILTTMMYAVSAMVLLVLALMTVLYLNIFLAEDKGENALLSAIGFSAPAVRASVLLRMLLLAAVSVPAAILLVRTAGLAAVRVLMELFVGLTGFAFEPMRLFTYLGMPALLLAAVLLPTGIRLLGYNIPDIHDLSEE